MASDLDAPERAAAAEADARRWKDQHDAAQSNFETRCKLHDLAENRAVAAEERVKRLEKALRDLVEINEQHNKAVALVIGAPFGWKDDYLNAARAALQEAPRDEH